MFSDSEKLDQEELEEVEEPTPKKACTKRPTGKKGKQAYSDTKEVVLKKALNILERTDEKTQRKQVEDEHDAFGRHIASQLRGMTEKDREFAHFKLQETIFNIKFSSGQQMMQPKKVTKNV